MEKKESFAKAVVEALVKANEISHNEALALQKAFKDSEKPYFDDFLLEGGLVDKEALLEALSTVFQVPAFDVVGYFFEHHLLLMFPKDLLVRNVIIPLEVDQNIMVMVANNPDDPDLLPQIGDCVSYDIRFRVGLRQDILDAIREFYDRAVSEVVGDEDLREDRQVREEERQTELEEEHIWEEDFEEEE